MTGTPATGTPRRLRVLVNALVCAPDEGSEPGAGWWWTVAAAVHHDVWLITLDTSRERIETARRERPDLAIHPVYVEQPRWLPGPAHDLRALRLRYVVWQRQAARIARDLHGRVGFDVAHHLTLASDWLPSAVVALPDVPFVWGPVGGYTRPAWPLARWLGPRWLLDEAARRAVTGVARARVGRRLARRAAVVVAQNEDAAARLARYRRRPVQVEPNVAIDPATLAASMVLRNGVLPGGGVLDGRTGHRPDADGMQRRTMVFAGRLVGWKGVRLAVAALARPQLDGWHLDVYGDGPQRSALARLAARRGVGDRVHLLGARPRHELLGALEQCDVLVLPSLNDSAGWVAAEAIALGCPVVCLDRGGPPGLVGASFGRVVPAAGDVPGRLARAVADVAGPRAPSNRWSRERLPGLVADWYLQAVTASPGPGPGRPRRGPVAGRRPLGSRPHRGRAARRAGVVGGSAR